MALQFVPVNRPFISTEDSNYVREALDSTWISGEGPYVKEFEETFSKAIGSKFGISVANGSIAIDLVIEALGIGPGDEVILPSFTIVSCMSQILRCGATPVFVDADSLHWNMDVGQVESLITTNTKAIIAVHIYGLPVDMDPLIEISTKYNIPIIEDAAEAHGLKYKDRVTGTMGLVSTFSFYANKNITTGEGGMILTDNEELKEKIQTLKNLGFMSSRRFVHDVLGWNGRLSSLQAALGTSQTKRLLSIQERRIEIGELYQTAFADLKNVTLPVKMTDYAVNNYWVFGLVLNDACGKSAIDIMKMLDQLGIGTRPFFYPLHTQPVLEKYGFSDQRPLPVAERLGEKGFYIPNGLGITQLEIERVIKVVREVIG